MCIAVEEHHLRRRARKHRALAIVAIIALIVQAGVLFLSLFEPPLPYKISPGNRPAHTSEEFLLTLATLTAGGIYRNNRVDIFTNGENFYSAELQAIEHAQRYINVECYIFERGEIAKRVLNSLSERARAGVKVRLLIDAMGSASTTEADLKQLTDAGGRLSWYHPLRWYTWWRFNNRTHRELLVVDGTTGFVGGAGFGDHWYKSGKEPRWRDMMARIEGDGVTGLDGIFAENWLESSGDVLLNPAFFPFQKGPGTTVALVIGSAPSAGRSTKARVLFQSLLATAQHQIHITSPYFLPDRSLAEEIARAVKERGVEVKIIVPGHKSDHALTRTSSRRLYGDLLQAGAQIYEYQPSMNHTKTLVVDGLWAVVGSTNIDSRSFGLNDELNVAFRDPAVAQRIEEDFNRDLGQSRRISYEEWRHRPLTERLQEMIGALLQRQQ